MARLNTAFCFSKSQRGFSILEALIALGVVAMVALVVSQLGSTISGYVKRAQQTGAILEIRNSMNALIKSPDPWLAKMRSSVYTQGIYAGCIPDPKLNVSTFKCPAIESDLLDDTELAKISTGYQISSAPIINSSGELIAGGRDEIVYLNSEGRLCDETLKAKCAFRSLGYLLRSNDKTDQDPGSIKFVVKVDKNPTYINASGAPMKAQYMSVEIGEDWKKIDNIVGSACPSGTIKVGYLSNGKPSCINPTSPCPSNDQYLVGVDNDGKPICKVLPQCNGSPVALSSTGNDFICVSSSPCGPNNLFLGYFGGSGEAICQGPNIKCSAGTIQVGISVGGDGKISADCVATPSSCPEANQRLSFDGTRFVCQSAAESIACGDNQLMTGIDVTGTPICTPKPESFSGKCSGNLVMQGVNSDGTLICSPPSSSTTNQECPKGEVMIGMNSNGTLKCKKATEQEEICTNSGGTWNTTTLKCQNYIGQVVSIQIIGATNSEWDSPCPALSGDLTTSCRNYYSTKMKSGVSEIVDTSSNSNGLDKKRHFAVVDQVGPDTAFLNTNPLYRLPVPNFPDWVGLACNVSEGWRLVSCNAYVDGKDSDVVTYTTKNSSNVMTEEGCRSNDFFQEEKAALYIRCAKGFAP